MIDAEGIEGYQAVAHCNPLQDSPYPEMLEAEITCPYQIEPIDEKADQE